MRVLPAVSSWKRLLSLLAVLLLLAQSPNKVVADDTTSFMREKYDGLSDKGKMAVGAAVGFLSARLVMSSAMSAVKVVGVAFITAAVVDYTGLMDELPGLSDEQSEMLNAMKNSAWKRASKVRMQIQRRLNPDAIQAFAEKERSATLGFAGGALIGVLL